MYIRKKRPQPFEYFRESLYPRWRNGLRAFPPSLSSYRCCSSSLCKLPWRHVCARPAPMSLALPLLSLVMPTKPAGRPFDPRSSAFLLLPSPPRVSHAFMHYKYLQISRVPYSIERRRRRMAKSAEAARATERRRRALLFGRCLPRLYGGGPVCVHTSSLQPQNGYRCMATTWSQIHPRILHFLSWI